jgi:hypothetical protein
MTSFVVKSRTTSPIVEATVDATSREDAIQQTVNAGAVGGEVEVLNCDEVPVPPVAAAAAAGGTTEALPPPA